jgi:hypothetical protein
MRPALANSRGPRRAGREIALAAVAVAIALGGAACGGDGDSAGATSPAAGPATLTADTVCADWLTAPAEAKAAALDSDADYTEGGINAWIAEARRTNASSPQAAAAVPDTVPVDEGVALVDRACAAVAPSDTVGAAIPAYDYQAANGGTTAP